MMKTYYAEAQKDASAKPRPVTWHGLVRYFLSKETAIRFGKVVKEQTGYIVKVVSTDTPPEVIEIC